jgi:hypothetical protein
MFILSYWVYTSKIAFYRYIYENKGRIFEIPT